MTEVENLKKLLALCERAVEQQRRITEQLDQRLSQANERVNQLLDFIKEKGLQPPTFRT